MAYTAEIEIGVKGAQRLQELRDRIDKLSAGIDQVNAKTFFGTNTVASIRNYNNALADAQENLNKTRLRLDEAGRAAGNYAKAIGDYVTALGASNGAQALTNRLISEEIELRRKQKLAVSGIKETAQQYAGPIGPGQASSTALSSRMRPQSLLLGGQTSPVEERIRRTLQQRADENSLQQALLRLEQKTTAELNRQLEAQESMIRGKREVLDLVDQTARKSRLLAGGPAQGLQGPLVGPGGMGFPVALPLTKAEQKGLEIAAKKQEILNKMAVTRQQLVGLATNLQRLDTNAVVAIEDANRAQNRLNAAKERELQISKQGALLRGDFSPIDGSPVTPGGRPIKGSPAFIKQQQERRRQQASGVALGAGFPLLFGGGAGSVIGGALGGLVPGPEGFAAQIALSALGQQLDTFATSLNGLADSLGNPTAALQAFETAGIKVDEAVKVQVENLVKQGEAYKAQQLIFEELTKALGPDAVQQLNAYDKELKNLEDAYKDLSDALIKELLPALTGILSFIDDFAGRIKKISETRIFKVIEKAAGFIPSFALAKAQFGAATARGKELAAKQPGTRDLDAETKDEMAEIRRKDLLERIKELQKEELSIIQAKAMSEQGLVDATARRMEVQSSVASAANAAFLQVNDLEMQRARNAGDTEKQYKLQLQRAQLIYTQTVLQVQQEQHKAALAVLSSQIKLKELQATVALKAAKGEALAEDYAAIELQKQAVQLAYEGVNAAKLIAQYNLMGANALGQMNVEQAAFNRTQAAGRARGGGGGGGAIGGGGGTVTRVTSMETTRSLGAATPQQLGIQLSAKGISGDFTEQQASATLSGLYEQRVQKYIDDRAAQGFGNISPNSVSDRQLERAGFAEGGFVTRPTDAMVGEGGQPEYVIPASKMSTAMQRYSAGVRGEAVTAGAVTAGSTSTANYSNQQNAYYGGGGGTSVNITTGPVIRMDNRDYVTMTDLQRGMAAAAGASQASMMRSMSRSYATRRSMGL